MTDGYMSIVIETYHLRVAYRYTCPLIVSLDITGATHPLPHIFLL